jgi:sulfatase modifying factor 1
VARFRGFVNAGRGTAANPPAIGSGAHPKVPNSGWAASYNASLLADTTTLASTVVSCQGFSDANYSGFAGTNDNKPMNCVTWYEAFAFCAWDGGRLPSVAELELATRGGSQQRPNPWGDAGIDDNHTFFCADASACINPSTGSMLNVGSLNNGAGRWGHQDLYGSMREYALDIWEPTPTPCNDCVQLDAAAATVHAAVGGSWADGYMEFIDIFDVSTTTSSQPRTPAGGFRCAYDL